MNALCRRRFCQITFAAGTLVSLPGYGVMTPRRASHQPALRIGAVALADGSFGISAVNPAGNTVWLSPVETRCHSGCRNPANNELVFVERRPGWAFLVLDPATGQRRHRINAEDGEHFTGHGVFSPDGQTLYLPVNRYEQGEGVIAVYDATKGYQRVRTLDLQGIGPHEITLHPDGRTLVIGLGGILTHPDYDRIKLNLDTMKPALILMDRISGEFLARFRPSRHQLSSRHVSVTPSGTVFVAYQYQGPLHERPPLVGRYRKGEFTEIDFGPELLARMGNYIASIVAHPENSLVAVASPVGGTTVIFDGDSGDVLNTLSLPDCAGTQALAGGDFLVSSGQGKLIRLGAKGKPETLSRQDLRWDHHLV